MITAVIPSTCDVPLSPTDINECLDQSMCGNGRCVNMEGSYRCNCFHGYKLSVQNLCQGRDPNPGTTHVAGCLCVIRVVLLLCVEGCYFRSLVVLLKSTQLGYAVRCSLRDPHSPPLRLSFLRFGLDSRCGRVCSPRGLHRRPLRQSGGDARVCLWPRLPGHPRQQSLRRSVKCYGAGPPPAFVIHPAAGFLAGLPPGEALPIVPCLTCFLLLLRAVRCQRVRRSQRVPGWNLRQRRGLLLLPGVQARVQTLCRWAELRG